MGARAVRHRLHPPAEPPRARRPAKRSTTATSWGSTRRSSGSNRASPAGRPVGLGRLRRRRRRTTPTSASRHRWMRHESRDRTAPPGAELHALDRRVRHRRGPERRATVRARRPGAARLVGRSDRELAQPHRPGWVARPRRLLHPRLHEQHRRRDHGARQVRTSARAVGGPRVARDGGATRRRSTRRCSCSPITRGPASRWPTRPSTSSTPSPAEALRQAKQAADGKDVRLGGGVSTAARRSSTPTSSTPCTSPSRPSRSAVAADSGSHPTSCSTASTTRRIPSPSGVVHHLFWRR